MSVFKLPAELPGHESNHLTEYFAALTSVMYNEAQLSLTHTQLTVGTPTSVTSLTSSESSQHNPKKEKKVNSWQKQVQ
jgi:hypothetical protein